MRDFLRLRRDNRSLAATLLAGALVCASPARAQGSDSEPAAAPTENTETPTPARPAFGVELLVPAPLDTWLPRHAELMRFQSLPDLGATEFERLLLTAPADIRRLLATQGYFSPQVEVRVLEPATGARTVRIEIDPGPLTRIASWRIELDGPARDDPAAAAQRAALHAGWSLTEGQVFTQQAWSEAKNEALRVLTHARYPEARVRHSRAEIDPQTGQARLQLELDSGPAHRFGALRVQGSERYDPETIERLTRLAGVEPGADYDEGRLQAAQQRLLDSGYFESAFVRIDPDGDPEAAPVEASVREVKRQKIVVGVGASTDNGARLSLEHQHHRLPWIDWSAASKLKLERDTSTLASELNSVIDERGWRWKLAGQLQRQQDGALTTDSGQFKLGRAQGGRQLERQFYAQYDRARIHDPALLEQAATASSLSAHYGWTQRAFDDLAFPTRGHGLALELGAGLTLSQDKQPYLRARLRWQAYRPAFEGSERPSRWALRLEGGAVWSRNGSDSVPATQRFLAGGEGSVRGYGLRDIGVPRADGGVDPGRLLALASLEWQRPIWLDGRRSDWESALFVDGGAVADQWRALSARTSVGAGLRYHSPVGPLQLDLAYGLERRALRLHMSVGFAF